MSATRDISVELNRQSQNKIHNIVLQAARIQQATKEIIYKIMAMGYEDDMSASTRKAIEVVNLVYPAHARYSLQKYDLTSVNYFRKTLNTIRNVLDLELISETHEEFDFEKNMADLVDEADEDSEMYNIIEYVNHAKEQPEVKDKGLEQYLQQKLLNSPLDNLNELKAEFHKMKLYGNFSESQNPQFCAALKAAEIRSNEDLLAASMDNLKIPASGKVDPEQKSEAKDESRTTLMMADLVGVTNESSLKM